LGENINTINKNTETLSDDSREVGLEANTQESMITPQHQNAGQNHNIKTGIASWHPNNFVFTKTYLLLKLVKTEHSSHEYSARTKQKVS
jgi:hypothetical protein